MKQIWLLIASLILIFVVSIKLIQDLQEGKYKVEVQNNVRTVLNQSITDLELLIYPSLLSAVVLSNSEEIKVALEGGERDQVTRQLSLLANSYAALSQVRVIDNAGHEFARVNATPQGVVKVSEPELQDKSMREYFLVAQEMPEKHVYVSQLEFNREHGEISFPLEPVIRVVSPIDNEDSRLGYLVFNIAFDKIIKELKFPQKFERIDIHLVDVNNNVLLKKEKNGAEILLANEQWGELDNDLYKGAILSKLKEEVYQKNKFYVEEEDFQFNTKKEMLPKGIKFYDGNLPVFKLVVSSEFAPVGLWSSFEKLDRLLILSGLLIALVLMVAFVVGRIQIEKRQQLISELNDELILSQSRLNNEKKKLQSLVGSLAHKNKLPKEFSSIISHNFRSPVSSLGLLVGYFHENYKAMGQTELKEIARNLTTASQSFNVLATDLAETINAINDEVIVVEKVNLRKVADSVLQRYQEEMRNSSIQYQLNDWSIIAYNEEYLRLILDQLFSNAFKYRSSKRKLEVTLSTSTMNGKMVLQFEDNGQGMDLDLHANNVFGMHRTFHENSEGRGMGLFLVKLYVENMGGNVFIESKLDVGTKFTLIFGS